MNPERHWASANKKPRTHCVTGLPKTERRSSRLSGVERYSEAECLLASCSLGALKRFGNFAGRCLFSGERLQFANLRTCPSNSFRFFHREMSLFVGRAGLIGRGTDKGKPQTLCRRLFVISRLESALSVVGPCVSASRAHYLVDVGSKTDIDRPCFRLAWSFLTHNSRCDAERMIGNSSRVCP